MIINNVFFEKKIDRVDVMYLEILGFFKEMFINIL